MLKVLRREVAETNCVRKILWSQNGGGWGLGDRVRQDHGREPVGCCHMVWVKEGLARSGLRWLRRGEEGPLEQ